MQLAFLFILSYDKTSQPGTMWVLMNAFRNGSIVNALLQMHTSHITVKILESCLPFNHFPSACSVQQTHCARWLETYWMQDFILEILLKIFICRLAEVLRLALPTRKTWPESELLMRTLSTVWIAAMESVRFYLTCLWVRRETHTHRHNATRQSHLA